MRLLLAIALIFGYIIGLRVVGPAIDRIGERKSVHPLRIKYISARYPRLGQCVGTCDKAVV